MGKKKEKVVPEIHVACANTACDEFNSDTNKCTLGGPQLCESGIAPCWNRTCAWGALEVPDHCAPDSHPFRNGRPVAECKCFIGGNEPQDGQCAAACFNTGCSDNDPGIPNGCETWAEVWECPRVVTAGWGPFPEQENANETQAAQVPQQDVDTTGTDLAGEGRESGAVSAAKTDGDRPATSVDGPASYVTREADFLGPPFTRELPVPVPDEELAELAKQMSHAHRVWIKAQLDAKAAAAGFKSIINQKEVEMVQLAGIIEEGTEERPVKCRWEFDYKAATKVLRRLDTFKLVGEPEILKGEELHMSFNFDGSSESAVEKLKEVQSETATQEAETEGLETAAANAGSTAGCGADEQVEGNPSICQHCKSTHPNCQDCCVACMRFNECRNAQFCALIDSGSICSICVGLCGDYTPGTQVADCQGFRAHLSTDQIHHRDTTCMEGWQECVFQNKCFGPANEEGVEGPCLCLADEAEKAKALEEARAKRKATIEAKKPDTIGQVKALRATGMGLQESLDTVNGAQPKVPSGYPCKICGFDAGSHIYLVRHLRDTHCIKLSDYKLQFPA